MVFHNKLTYGSTVYNAPTIPQVPKSVKRKRSTRKKHDDKELSAFDLLATVAGEMLLEMNSHSNLNRKIKKEIIDNMQIKCEDFDVGSCSASTLHHGSGFRRQVDSYTSNEKKMAKQNFESENISEIWDIMDLDVKNPALISSDSSMVKPISKTRSFPNFRNGFELDIDNDDDENSSGSTRSYSFDKNTCKKYVEHQAIDSRSRKLLSSKFYKGSPSTKMDGKIFKTDVQRKMCYTRQRTQRSLFKRQKLYEHHCIERNKASGPKSLLESGECLVKFSIKSIMVPEIYINIPETATIGLLKKSVMDAVASVVESGLRVSVVYEGKKVCDDTQTLFQTGIFHNRKIENLGFMLEPNSTQTAPSLTCEDSKFILSSDSSLPCSSVEAERRNPALVSTIDQVPPPNKLTECALAQTLNSHDGEHEFVHSPSVEMVDNSKAMVPVPSMAAGPLSITPLQKSKRSELVQRRIRRPFSVAEVEALVHAVEKLGTGRWRDVKIRAFDNAKHRTYVDLKDKWKTLVHTATIAPQQRRGEPVPQELLDRVLWAQNYWSRQQAKFRLSSTPPDSCFLA